uniref:DUF11 domain-containing protein n=1 Tax=Microbulbifer mangrovi TaxID=927787 RepID=UPI00117D4A93
NNGTADASGVVITETLPEYASFDAANSDPRWVLDGDTLTLALGELAAGENGSVDFAVIIDDPIPAGVEELDNTATIEDDGNTGPDQNLEDNTDDEVTPTDAQPDYVIDKIENFDDPTNPGDAVEWTIEVSNQGNQGGTGVVVTDTLPDTNLFTNFVASDGGIIDLDAGTVTWNIGNLAAGDSVTLSVAAVVVEDVPSNVGPQTNTVVVDDDGSNGEDPTPENNRDDEILEIEFVDLYIDKDDNDAVPKPSETLVYTLEYGNRGTATAAGVVITETLPANTSFDAANSTSGWVQNGDTFTFDVGTLAPGEEGSITFAVIVDYPLDATVQQVDNTAVITDDGNNGKDQNIEDNTDSDATEIENNVNVDFLTLLRSDMYPYPTVTWEREFLQLHGRLITLAHADINANLQGGHAGLYFDPVFGPVGGEYYPNGWAWVFYKDLSISVSFEPEQEKSSPLALDKDFGNYRANSRFGEFERPAASPRLPVVYYEITSADEAQSPLLETAPEEMHPSLHVAESNPVQQQLEEITREISESRVSPLLLALAELSQQEAAMEQAMNEK